MSDYAGATVSVIVPTKNSASTLAQCLRSVRDQTYKNIELIVVDNHSADNTESIAAEFADRVLVVGPERSAQTNAGARVAEGDYVYRVDSDFILPPDLIGEAVAACLQHELDAVLIHNQSDPSVSYWARVRHFEREMYRGDSLNVASRFVRRELFLALGGLDEALTAGEDYDFHRRLVNSGAHIGWIGNQEIHLGEPKSLGEVIGKHFVYGRQLRRYARKHGLYAVKQLSPLRPALRRNLKVLLRHPLQALGLVGYLFVKYGAGLAGFLSVRSKPASIRSDPPTRLGGM